MQFAWLRENSEEQVPAKAGLANRLVFIAYNLIWWVPIVLGLTKIIDYQTAFVAFFVITILRAVANVIRNNFLTLAQAETFPFRAP